MFTPLPHPSSLFQHHLNWSITNPRHKKCPAQSERDKKATTWCVMTSRGGSLLLAVIVVDAAAVNLKSGPQNVLVHLCTKMLPVLFRIPLLLLRRRRRRHSFAVAIPSRARQHFCYYPSLPIRTRLTFFLSSFEGREAFCRGE